MREIKTMAQEAAEDIFFGQVVMIWARWFLIAAGIILTLWTAENETQVVLGVIPVVGLVGLNFYLHGRYLAERPASPALITVASLLDLAAVTVVVMVWPGQSGLASPFFIMYYPVILAFAFVMPPRISVAYTVVALAAYVGACFVGDVLFVNDVDEVKALIIRLITLAAMGGLGAYYWRIQRNRRPGATGEAAGIDHSPSAS